MLDIWPALPLFILDARYYPPTKGVDNTIAALKQRHRVCKIKFCASSSSDYENVWAAMQEPFPELADIMLMALEIDAGIPDSFLGGSAPGLRCLKLYGIPFPGLPKLLLSATHLVTLCLEGTSHSEYTSPDVMANCLSALTNLETLALEFEHLNPENRRPPPPTRSVLPALTNLEFTGDIEYWEDLVARVDAPRLFHLSITFLHHYQIAFDTPHHVQFISRTPRLEALEKARITFGDKTVRARLSSQTSGNGVLDVGIPCSTISTDEQFSCLAQICASSLPPLSAVENLSIIEDHYFEQYLQENIADRLWLELLRPFASVKNLYIHRESLPRIAPTLQKLVGDRTTEVLPILQNLFTGGSQPSRLVQEGIEQFAAARRLSGRPITVSPWDRASEQEGVTHPPRIVSIVRTH
ncbi:hypothetical protein DFH94DRAFT_236941 [Russula ochroleuca]|uniref:Uncharacterized protein n=1 Tax=Russula ochroleuca TaxID=152965 RepID=A0A9P5N2A8_9AGAM|nr:hypothetical protein DFH94DRAFT_236941 [Russula ochroleuca]